MHHIDTTESKDNLSQLMQEWARVLAPGGVLIVNHTFPEQVDAFWYVNVLCRAKVGSAAQFARRFASRAELQGMAQAVGLKCWSEHPVPEPLQGPGYYDRTGYHREAWRDCDSFFSWLGPHLPEALPVLDAVTPEQMTSLRETEARLCQTTTISLRKPKGPARF